MLSGKMLNFALNSEGIGVITFLQVWSLVVICMFCVHFVNNWFCKVSLIRAGLQNDGEKSMKLLDESMINSHLIALKLVLVQFCALMLRS